MKTQFDIEKVLENGNIKNELDFERAQISYRKLRVLAKDNPKFKALRKKLGNLIKEYEDSVWADKATISEEKLKISDIAEEVAEQERLFIQKRKEMIKAKLKLLGLNQQQLGSLLGHSSKSYISELMNGIRPFIIRDLIVINRLLNINLEYLVPIFLPQSECLRIKNKIEKLDNPQLKLCKEDLIFA